MHGTIRQIDTNHRNIHTIANTNASDLLGSSENVQKNVLQIWINSTINRDTHKKHNQEDYNWYNEPFAVSRDFHLYLHMHGLIFNTSISLLAGSTR